MEWPFHNAVWELYESKDIEMVYAEISLWHVNLSDRTLHKETKD